MNGKNSKFKYMYRDASNYKQFGEIVFSGEPEPEDEELVKGNLHEGDFFIPADILLPSLQDGMGSVNSDDHPWHAIDLDGGSRSGPFVLTCDPPTDTRSVHQFASEFSRAIWDEIKASKKMGLL